MPDEPPEDLIRYDILTQDAVRGVVKKIITETAKAGLPGEHHFFVSFLTNFPNVRLSTRMRERYPDEMTIVIQHQYWDLKAHENSFEIGLSFDDIPESLSIPFAAIKGFFDPSVQFGLQFDIDDELDEQQDGSEDNSTAEEGDHEVVVMEPEILKTKKKLSAKSKKKKQSDAVTDKAENDSDDASSKDKNDESASAEVVSLDAFRKKP